MKKPRVLNVNLLADFYPMWPIAAEMISISLDRNKLWCSKPLGLSADLTLYNCQMRRDFKLDFIINLLCQFAEARRSHQIEQLTRERRQQHSQQMTEWKKRYLERKKKLERLLEDYTKSSSSFSAKSVARVRKNSGKKWMLALARNSGSEAQTDRRHTRHRLKIPSFS